MDSEKIYELLQEYKKGQISRRDVLRAVREVHRRE